tara:strand:+ start:3640 stop:5310 length:1671 start_codon:yes stop_codon:yes gene_type:complete
MESIFKDAEDAKRKLEEAMRNYETESAESEAADEEEQDAKNEIIEVLKPNEEKLAAWVFQQPLSSDYDMIRNMSEEFNLSLTDAKKSMPALPKSPLIGDQTIPQIVRDLRYMRRKFKGNQRIKISKTIDHLISGYEEHIQKSIDSIYWLKSYQKPLLDMSITERKLEKLDNIKDDHTRNKVVDSLCSYWESSIDRKSLDYGDKYASLTHLMKAHKKEFNSIVKKIAHQSLRKNKKELIKDEVIKTVCEYPGKEIKDIKNLLSPSYKNKVSTQIISKMLRSNGATVIDKKYYMFSDEIKKDIYSYVAGVIDSDGFITMDSKCSPRVGIVATGDRGKAFVTELHKELKVGKLHLDQPGYNETNRTTSRLNFYSMNDIEELLSKAAPYLKMKGPQAKLIMESIRIKRSYKKEDWAKPRLNEIFKIIKYENWKDAASSKELDKYDINVDDINKYRTNCKLGLMDEMDTISKTDVPGWRVRDMTGDIIVNLYNEGVYTISLDELKDKIKDKLQSKRMAATWWDKLVAQKTAEMQNKPHGNSGIKLIKKKEGYTINFEIIKE